MRKYNNISALFGLLIELNNHYKFTPSQIYNVDKTGINTVLNKPPQPTKDKKQVGTICSGERGTTVTCFSATGREEDIPPLMIFPRARENFELLEGLIQNLYAFLRDG